MPHQDFSAFGDTELRKIHEEKVRQLQSMRGWSKIVELVDEIRSIEQSLDYRGPKCLTYNKSC